MSEYIINTATMDIDRKHPITRCHDCDHFREVRMSDGSSQHRCSGVMAYVEPDPMGFCAWPNLKEGAE